MWISTPSFAAWTRNASQREAARAAPEPHLDAPADISDGAGGTVGVRRMESETAAEAPSFTNRTADDEAEK